MRGISGKVERHVALVALAEIDLGVLRPHVGLGQQHAAGRVGVDLGADAADDVVRLGQVLVAGAVALDQVRHRVEPQPVDAEIEPEPHRRQHLLHHRRVVEVEVGLVAVEAVPVIGLGLVVPGPVRLLGVAEDDARAGILGVGVGPDVEVALGRARRRPPCALEPAVLVGGVVDHQLGDDAQSARVRRHHELAEVGQRAVVGMHAAIVGDVIAVVAARARIEGQHPDRGDAEIDDVVELLQQAREIADAVVVAVKERLDVDLVDHRVLVPERVLYRRQRGGQCHGNGPGDVLHDVEAHAAGQPAGSARQIR